jgi:hypothetical protein
MHDLVAAMNRQEAAAEASQPRSLDFQSPPPRCQVFERINAATSN